MTDLVTLLAGAIDRVRGKAAAESREATAEEYRVELTQTYEAWLNASVERDMALAGFVKTERGWEQPKKWWGFWL